MCVVHIQDGDCHGRNQHSLRSLWVLGAQEGTGQVSVDDDRWESGKSHRPESVQLIALINDLDDELHVGLEMGGDGDIGETLAYFLDELIETGKIEIRIK